MVTIIGDSMPPIPQEPIPQVVADVIPAQSSKINIAQVVALGSVLLTILSKGHFGLTDVEQATIVSAIGIITPITTIVFRTWFTTKIVVASAKKLPLSVSQ